MSAPPAPKKSKRNEISRMQEDSIVCEDEEEDSAFTLYFVETSDGNPTEQEISNITELFKVAKNAGVMPEWINSESVGRIRSSDDFFVLPCFRGTLFRKLQANKLKLYGPPIVLECLTELKPLPQWTHPIYSSAFEGAKVAFTSIEPEKRKELCEKIAWMNGVVSGPLYYESTHLIADKAERTEKYKVAASNSVHLMRKEWVDELWETSQTAMGKFSALSKDAINSYKLKVFEGLEIAVTSIDGADRANLIQLIEEHGGKVPGNMSKSKCSYLITDKTSGQKYLKATEWKTIRVVQTRWVRKCIDSGHLIAEANYHPKNASTEHIRSSTPKKDTGVPESVPDVSSIAGHGGRLNASSFNMSSAMTPMETSSRRQSGSSFLSMSSTSNVTSTTINTDVTIGRITGARKSDQFSTPIVRNNSVSLARYATTPSMSTQGSVDSGSDPINEVRKLIDSELRELFDNCIFYMIGLDEKKSESWVRLFNETGATRVSRYESATHVVIVTVNQQERAMIRRIMQQEDISIVTVQWVVESVKQRSLLPVEDFGWSEFMMDDFQSQSQKDEIIVLDSSNMSVQRIPEPNVANNTSCPPIFSHQTYYVHPSLGEVDVAHFSELIQNSGGRIEMNPENAKYVVFGHSAPMHTLLSYDIVITTLYVDFCHNNGFCPPIKNHALLVPLPSPPLPIFQNRRFVLRNSFPHVINFVKDIIESNGGRVIDEMDTYSYKIMVGKGTMTDEPEHCSRTADLSWIIASVSRCQLQPFEEHRYKEMSEPLSGFEREDDVWMKCVRERDDSTEEIEEEIEERHKIQNRPVETGNGGRGNVTAPYENPYFPDLRKPYKMNLNLEGVAEYIENMESPLTETQDSMTNSRVGSILRKAVVNTGRRVGKENEDEPMTCEVLKARLPVAENRRTVSSTPVLVRDVDRSTRFMPMDESFIDQNQEHEELNLHYAMHPHFLLSVSNMSQQQVIELQEAIHQLGGKIEKDFNRDVTHLITSNMQRTPKVLSSIAAGKWCLTPEYVTKSTASGRWLDEKKFEWTPDKLPQVTSDQESTKDRENRKILEKLVSVCKMWRIRVEDMPITSSVRMENRVNGAFTGWRCVIHHDDKKTQQIASILEAGGAIVHSITDYIEITSLDPNRAFAFKDFKWNPQSAAMLKRDKIPLYVFEIIYEYLVDKDNLNCSKFLHPVYKKV